MGEVFVVDTSSIIQVRQLMAQEPKTRVTAVYAKLIGLSQRGVLCFPKGIIEEIKVGETKAARGPDPACSWADACAARAVANHEVLIEAKEVLTMAVCRCPPRRERSSSPVWG